MDSLDKKAFKFGIIAAAVAAVLPLLIQTIISSNPIIATVA